MVSSYTPRVDAEHVELAELEREADAFVAAVDEVLQGAVRCAGERVVCRLGCIECCTGPFDITALDAFRLRRGLAWVASRAPETAAAIERRARRQWRVLARYFPGDWQQGRLADDDAARLAFFERFAPYRCPVLEPASGRCLLYEHRPLSCRSFGVPVLVGDELLPPCRRNFVGADVDELRRAAVDPDPLRQEDALLARLAALGQGDGDTIVAAALACTRG